MNEAIEKAVEAWVGDNDVFVSTNNKKDLVERLTRIAEEARRYERERIRLKLWATLDENEEVMRGGRKFIEEALSPSDTLEEKN